MNSTVDRVTGFLCFGKPQGAKGMDNTAGWLLRPLLSPRHRTPGRNVKVRQLFGVS